MIADVLIDREDRVLITGSNGFIGRAVVQSLLDLGYTKIRCFVRPSSDITGLRTIVQPHLDAGKPLEIIEGNLLAHEDCARAVADVAVVLHLAAGIDKSYAGCFMNSVVTTRNLLDAVVADRSLKRFVNVSSFAVYSTFDMKCGSVVDETTPLEPAPMERADPYGYGKLKQEEIVERYNKQFGIPYVTIRPGAVWGPGKASLSGRVGIDTFGVFVHLGGSNRIPFTYVDNCAEAIVRGGLVPGVDGEIFNVVDDQLPTSRQFLRLYKRHVGWFPSIPMPYRVAYPMSALWEQYSIWSEGQLPARFNRRRAAAEWKPLRYSNDKVKHRLGWTPRVSFTEASRRYFASLERSA